MCRNVGTTEKGIRLVVGGIFMVVPFLLELPNWGTIGLMVVGGIALITGMLGYCPAWTLFGINTYQVQDKAQRHYKIWVMTLIEKESGEGVDTDIGETEYRKREISKNA